MNRTILAIGVLTFFITIPVLYLFNTCKSGGFMGINECDRCRGIKILKSRESYADGFDTYSCIGIFR